jgi:hypothetical protein
MMKKILIAIILAILSSFLIWHIYKFLYTPRIVFGAKGFTEYSPGSPGKVFVQVLDNFFSPVNNAICRLTVYYPNTTKFVDNVLMIPFENGLYYWDFVAPDVEGVYMTTVSCTYPSDLIVLTPSQSQYWYKDSVVMSGTSLTATIPIPSGVSGKAELLIFFTAIDSANPVTIQINNTVANRWDVLGTATVNTPQLSFVIDLSTYRPVTVRMTAGRSFSVDLLNLYAYRNATVVQTNLRGGGEIHVEVKRVAITPDEGTPQIKTIS